MPLYAPQASGTIRVASCYTAGMTNTYMMALIGMVIMAVAIWAPTIYVWRRKHRSGEAVKPVHLALAMALELIAFLLGAVSAQLLGFPGGEYLLIIALVVGAVGGHVLSSITFVPRS
jgi:hypothetical protein